MLENDLVEAIIGLPTDTFYNTGISTYREPKARKRRFTFARRRENAWRARG